IDRCAGGAHLPVVRGHRGAGGGRRAGVRAGVQAGRRRGHGQPAGGGELPPARGARPAGRAAQHRAGESLPRASRARARQAGQRCGLHSVVPEEPFRELSALGAGRAADGQNVIVPSNFTILQVIFFAGLVGFALVKLGAKTAGVRALMDESRELMIQVTRFVLEATPIGTFVLIAALVGSYGFGQLVPLGKFVIALYAACAFHVVVVYSGLLMAHGLSPLKFFRGAAPAMQVGFVASSSFAALPLSLSSATHNLGVDKDYASFAVPLGASIKMDGCGAIYPALGAVFIAQFMGLELSAGQYVLIALASVLGSFGTAGVPGTAVIMATVVISAAGLPLEAIGILYAIDRILDMMRTMTNVTGQVLVPVLVARQTGLLDRAVFERASSNVGIEDDPEREPGRPA